MQHLAHGHDLGKLIGDAHPREYARMLTAANMVELLEKVEADPWPEVMETKSIATATVDSLAKAETLMHNSVLCCYAAATVQVSF